MLFSCVVRLGVHKPYLGVLECAWRGKFGKGDFHDSRDVNGGLLVLELMVMFSPFLWMSYFSILTSFDPFVLSKR